MATNSDHPATADTAAVVTLAAGAQVLHLIDSLEWSYDGTPTGGNLKVDDDTTTIWQTDITTSGPGFFRFENGLYAIRGNSMTITLAAGGPGIKGKVNVQTK